MKTSQSIESTLSTAVSFTRSACLSPGCPRFIQLIDDSLEMNQIHTLSFAIACCERMYSLFTISDHREEQSRERRAKLFFSRRLNKKWQSMRKTVYFLPLFLLPSFLSLVGQHWLNVQSVFHSHNQHLESLKSAKFFFYSNGSMRFNWKLFKLMLKVPTFKVSWILFLSSSQGWQATV